MFEKFEEDEERVFNARISSYVIILPDWRYIVLLLQGQMMITEE